MSGEKKERTIQKITFNFFIVARPSSLSKNGSARSDLHAYFRFVTVLYWVVSDPAIIIQYGGCYMMSQIGSRLDDCR